VPLVPGVLQSQLLSQWLLQRQDSPGAIAQSIARAYDAYAAGAMAGLLTPAVRLPGQQAMVATLTAGLVNAPSGAVFAQKMAQACMAYWLTPPMQFVGTGTGVATLMPGMPGLVAGLTALFASNQGTAPQAAQRMASLMDAATRTVVVMALIPPAVSPVPTPLT
jgi:hypothetical protein